MQHWTNRGRHLFESPPGAQAGAGRPRVAEAWTITQDDVEQAWQRFVRTVTNEPVPDVWRQSSGGAAAGPPPAGGDGAVVVREIAFDRSEPFRTESAAEAVGSAESVRRRRAFRHRRWWKGMAAAAVLLAAGGLFASPAGDRVLADAMQTLYFQNLMGVGGEDLTQIANALDDAGIHQVDLSQYGTVEKSGGDSESHAMTLAAAEQATGLSVPTLPNFNPASDHVFVTGARVYTFRLHVDAINRLIRMLGGTHPLPQAADGVPIVVRLPGQVFEQSQDANGSSVGLDVTGVPTVEVPPDVDLNAVRQALIGLPFLPSDIRQSLMQADEWQKTLYLPVGGQPVDVTVNGHAAVAVLASRGSGASITWLANGTLYQLTGSPKTFPTVHSLVQAAEALTK
ncbi:MAG: hypothetical protein IRZ33_07675 [Alicyclobacillaceae bacterium]|nr:hypothetical protein [Alicyclobacillaceae bacterium]